MWPLCDGSQPRSNVGRTGRWKSWVDKICPLVLSCRIMCITQSAAVGAEFHLRWRISWKKQWVMTGRVLLLLSVVTACSKLYFVVLIPGRVDLGIWFEIGALQRDVAATIAYSIVSDPTHKGIVRFIATCRMRGNDGGLNLCPCIFR